MRKRVMVLDDDKQIRESLLKLLQAEDYEVVLAADGSEALEEFGRQPIELLLLDLNLPTENGWEIFEHVTSANPLLPVIIITGRAKQSEMAMAAGAGALMEKPLDIPLLLKTMAELLVEAPEKRLKRLIGVEHSTRYFRPASVATSNLKRFKPRWEQKEPPRQQGVL
jgi:DNA-binding response OmpR family regulator